MFDKRTIRSSNWGTKRLWVPLSQKCSAYGIRTRGLRLESL